MTGPLVLRRRPDTVEAWQVTEQNIPEIAAWAGGTALPLRGVGLYTDNNDFVVTRIGDWVVRGQFAEFYPVPNTAIFSRFEAVVSVVTE